MISVRPSQCKNVPARCSQRSSTRAAARISTILSKEAQVQAEICLADGSSAEFLVLVGRTNRAHIASVVANARRTVPVASVLRHSAVVLPQCLESLVPPDAAVRGYSPSSRVSRWRRSSLWRLHPWPKVVRERACRRTSNRERRRGTTRTTKRPASPARRARCTAQRPNQMSGSRTTGRSPRRSSSPSIAPFPPASHPKQIRAHLPR